MKSLNLARQAMNVITQRVPQATLNRTSYCAIVVKLANGTRAVVVAEAGATASGINGPLVTAIDSTLGVPVIPCASTIQGLGTWHMNDAEQQAIRTIQTEPTFAGGAIRAAVANRAICGMCQSTLNGLGLIINGGNTSEAYVP
jgi:hypothetical protein